EGEHPMTNPLVAYVSGIPSRPTVKVRNGPSTNYDPPMFEIPVGTANLPVLEVRVDEQGTNIQGRTYQWFRLQFPNGQIGWTRDDLLTIGGDGTPYGYGVIVTPTVAGNLIRAFVPNIPASPVAPVGVIPAAPVAPIPAAPIAPVAPAAPTLPSTPTQPVQPVTVMPVTPPAPVTPAPVPTVVVVPVIIPVTTTAPAPVAPAAPVVPVAPVAPVAPVPAAPPPVAPVPAPPSNQPTAIIKTMGAAPTRTGPSTTFPRTSVILNRNGRYPILQVQRENAGQQYRWFQVSNAGQSVWIREDLVTYDGDTFAFGLPTDLYHAPMKDNYWWVRGFNMPPNMDQGLVQHDGWDQGAATGEPIYCGPYGGTVAKTNVCAKCTPDRPNAASSGYDIGDPAIVNDPGWGYGYGTYVIVWYTNAQLPASTRTLLASRGFGDSAAMGVMYAHLAQKIVNDGQVLTPGQQIGMCGNTGNSEATHIHLESRA
ncbi:MAG: M23 family metallopeptidase, partial [Chloroflexota bacterium]